MQDTFLTSNNLVAVLRADIADLKAHNTKQNKRFLLSEGFKLVLFLLTLTATTALVLRQLWDMIGPSL